MRRMDLPFAVRGDVIAHDGVGPVALYEFVHLIRVEFVLVRHQTLAELKEHRMVKIVVLPSCQRPPREPVIYLEGEPLVCPSVPRIAWPERARKSTPRLSYDIVVGHAGVPCRAGYGIGKTVVVNVIERQLLGFGFAEALPDLFLSLVEVIAVKSRMVLLNLPLLLSDLSVRETGEGHYDVRGFLGLPHGDILIAAPLDRVGVPHVHVLVVERLSVEHDAVEAVLGLRQRPERDVTVMDVRVIPFDNVQVRHCLSGDGFALSLLPVLDAAYGRLRDFAGGVVGKRGRHYVLHRFREVFLRHLGELLREELEGIPVALCFPVRSYRRAHRVYERVELCGVDVLLLIPVGRRKHYIRIGRGRGHAELERRYEVYLAYRSLLEIYLLTIGLGDFFPAYPLVGAE